MIHIDDFVDAVKKSKSGTFRVIWVVVDIGGGTSDLTKLGVSGSMKEGGKPEFVFDTLSISGDNHLGGQDIDYIVAEAITDDVWKKLEAEFGIEWTKKCDTEKKKKIAALILAAAEKIKCKLATAEYVKHHCNIYGCPMDIIVTRTEINKKLKKFKKKLKKCYVDCVGKKKFPENILLVGGSASLWFMKQFISDLSRLPNDKIHLGFDSRDLVAKGAAYIARDRNGYGPQYIVFDSVVANTISVRVKMTDTDILVPRNTSLVLFYIIDFIFISIFLILYEHIASDITRIRNHDLFVNTYLAIPCERTAVYRNGTDNVDYVNADIYQGEASTIHDLRKLGTAKLVGDRIYRKYELEMVLHLEIDSNGKLSVKVHQKGKDKITGKFEKNIYIDCHSQFKRLKEERKRDNVEQKIDHANILKNLELKYMHYVRQLSNFDESPLLKDQCIDARDWTFLLTMQPSEAQLKQGILDIRKKLKYYDRLLGMRQNERDLKKQGFEDKNDDDQTKNEEKHLNDEDEESTEDSDIDHNDGNEAASELAKPLKRRNKRKDDNKTDVSATGPPLKARRMGDNKQNDKNDKENKKKTSNDDDGEDTDCDVAMTGNNTSNKPDV